MEHFSEDITPMSMVVMRSDGRGQEIGNTGDNLLGNVETGVASQPWGNRSQEEFLASLPVYDMFPLRTLFCKLYRILEHVGRALSTFVLAAMACDRFLRVCYPHKKISRKCVIYQLIVLSGLTFLLLAPLLIRSSSQEIILKEVLLERPYRLARVRIYKCVDHLDGAPLAMFITYMFLIGFAIPVLLIIVFYALMVIRLVNRSRTISSSQLPVARVASYTIAISAFFVLCWSPYWIAMLYLNLYRSYSDTSDAADAEFTSSRFILIMYGIHSLPYFCSSSNWLLYGLLNSQLMRRANESKKLKPPKIDSQELEVHTPPMIVEQKLEMLTEPTITAEKMTENSEVPVTLSFLIPAAKTAIAKPSDTCRSVSPIRRAATNKIQSNAECQDFIDVDVGDSTTYLSWNSSLDHFDTFIRKTYGNHHLQMTEDSKELPEDKTQSPRSV
ncbi:hypothetical protein M3Y94_00764600 [Aphelenchoides besseyi]|nr:hypothetical protein M3Y94_00764600 [Aphelenchoides besseyi]